MIDNSESFIFTFSDKRRILLSQNQVLNISTSFYYKHINKENGNILEIPNNISYETFNEFLDIFQKNSPILEEQNSQENKLVVNENVDLVQLIQISEYFENYEFSIYLINELFLYGENKINKNNSYLLLILSFNKLNELNNNNNNYNNEEDIETVWLDLFMKSLDIVGKNLLYFFEDGKLDIFDKKIIDELFEKFAMNLISNDFLIESEENKNGENIINNKNKDNNKKIEANVKNENSNIHNINTFSKENNEKNNNNNENKSIKSNENKNIINLNILRKIIEFLINRRSQNDFFCLLSNEFMKISSEENINEINNLPNPTFLLKLDINDINNYYEEFPIENQINNNDQKKIVFIIYYKKTEDSFNVSLKLTKVDKQNGKNNNSSNNLSYNNNTFNTLDILTFLSSVSIEELDIKQINIKSISNNKSMHEILKINNFSKLLSISSNEYLTLKIFLKPCYTHSILCSYLFYNFEQLYNNKNISKIPKSLLNNIIRKKLVNNSETNMDNIVICLFNWLNDEINIREDISEIIENIKWNNLSLPLLFEFILKYAKNISQNELEHIFLNSLLGRSQNYSSVELFNQDIIKSLFNSARKMDYISLFCENQRLNKFNSYEMINHERNISLNNISQKKNSIDNKNSEQSSIINCLNINNNNNDSFPINITLNKKAIIDPKKNAMSLSKKNFDIMDSPKIIKKVLNKKNKKDNCNKRNISVDVKYLNTSKNKTTNNTKNKHQRIYLENNNKNIFNKSLHNNKINKFINNKDIINNENEKKSKNRISLITELNKLKLKVKPNSNQILQKNQKKYRNKTNSNGILNKTDNNFY